MSFTFNWPRFSDQFHYDAIQMLNNALNKGNKPPIIADRIEVVELEMGTQPPELEIRDIGDLTVDQFRGIFRLTYSGDAHIVLKTKVQANPLNHKQPDIHLMTGSRGMLAAKEPLVVPMLLRLSHFKLNSYVVLVVSKQKGITLVFKTDPLQNVDINSTFDSIAVIQKFIQREIEGQLRQMFREDLPGIIHRLSQQWVKAKVEAPYLHKQQPPPIRHHAAESDVDSDAISAVHSLPPTPLAREAPPFLARRAQSVVSVPRRPRSVSGRSTASTSKAKSHKPPSPPNPLDSNPVTFPDLENFDPTYGLRPEGLPSKSAFRGFGNLFRPTRGLADLAEDDEEDEDEDEYEDEDEDDDGAASFDIVNWEYTVPPSLSMGENTPKIPAPTSPEYETIPAVGGGTITRPRIFHSQSLLQSPSDSPGWNSPIPLGKPRPSHLSHLSSLSGYSTPGGSPHFSAGLHNTFHPPIDYFDPNVHQSHQSPSLRSASAFSTHRRNYTPDSEDTQHSNSTAFGPRSTSTPPTEPPVYDDEDDTFMYAHSTTQSPPRNLRPPSATTFHRSPLPTVHPFSSRPPTNAPSSRRTSISAASAADSVVVDSDGFPTSSSPPNQHSLPHFVASHSASGSGSGAGPKIVLRPSLNSNSLSHLTTLSHSNHTLSPYTRAPQHFTVRSVPPSARAAPHPTVGPVKAKRKRIFRLGGNNKGKGKEDEEVIMSARSRQRADEADFNESDMDQYFRMNESEYEASDVFASPPAPPPLPLSPTLPGSLPDDEKLPLLSRSVSSQVRAALLQHRQNEQMYLHQRHPYHSQLYPT